VKLLGISCYYHDSAACLIDEGRIVAAAQEERFTRIKHDSAFPVNAVRYCLAQGAQGSQGGQGGHAGLAGRGEDGQGVRIDGVVFYDKPLLKFHRILETYLAVAPRGLRSYVQALPLWLREKLWIPPRIEEALEACGAAGAEAANGTVAANSTVAANGSAAGGGGREPANGGSARRDGAAEGQPPIYFAEHHESHAASAFYPSPFDAAAVLTLDGVGEWATTTIGVGEGERLRLIREIRFPHSLGLLYSAFTYFTGFRVNSGEYKLMGLAPYGTGRYTDLIKRELIDVKEDGSFRLNMEYFGYLDGLAMTNDRFAALFGGPPRPPESPLGVREMDLARSIQEVTEEVVLKLARHARELTGKRCLCLAGGVALNCVANGILLRAGIFDDLWIQPAAGDAGGALGAPLALVWIGIGAVLDEHRSREQIVGLAEYVGEIARVGVGHGGGLVAVDHDARRVAAALVRVTQLDTPAAYQRWLVDGQRVLERARQLACRHGAHRRLVGAHRGLHELPHTAPMARGDEMQRRKGHEVQFQGQLALDLLALLRCNPVPLVDRDDERPPALERQSQHARVLLGDRVVRIEHHNDHVRFVDGLQRLGDACALDQILDPGATPHPGGVDQQERAPIAFEGHQDAVAGGAGLLVRDHTLLSQQAIHQRGLADVRAADDGDANGVGVLIPSRLRLKASEHPLHELLAPLTVARGDGKRLTQPQGMEVCGNDVGVEPFRLVEDQRDGLARAAQLVRNEMILRRESGARVGEEYQAVSFCDGAFGLCAHLRFDAGRVLYQTTGVDDDAGYGT